MWAFCSWNLECGWPETKSKHLATQTVVQPRLSIRDANIQVSGSPCGPFLPDHSTIQLTLLSRQEKNNFTLWYKQTRSLAGLKPSCGPKGMPYFPCKEGFSVNKPPAAQSRAFSDSLHSSKLLQNPLSITRSNSPSEGLVILSCYYKSETSISQLQNLETSSFMTCHSIKKAENCFSFSTERNPPPVHISCWLSALCPVSSQPK